MQSVDLTQNLAFLRDRMRSWFNFHSALRSNETEVGKLRLFNLSLNIIKTLFISLQSRKKPSTIKR